MVELLAVVIGIPPKIEEANSLEGQPLSSMHMLGWQTLARSSSREARECIGLEIAQKLEVLPLGVIPIKGREVLTVASTRVNDTDLEMTLKFATGKEIRLVAVNPKTLAKAIHAAYFGDESNFNSRIENIPTRYSISSTELVAHYRQLVEFRSGSGDPSELLALLVDYAIARNASDIQFIPKEDGGYVRVRIDGAIYSHDEKLCSLTFHSNIIQRLKVLCGLSCTHRNLPQDGSFTVPLGSINTHIRVSLMPTVNGEKAALRLMGADTVLKLDQLGFHPRIYEFLATILQKKEGAIIFSGPTGSGKSTTMYSVLEHMKNRNLNRVSIEDPVEIRLQDVAQTQIDDRLGLTYSCCLRAVLRQDPDVILIGEIRDEESAKIAMHAAITGHLLLSTVHAKDSRGVFSRLTGLGVPRDILTSALQLIICQRLIPKLCVTCRVFDLDGYRFLNSSGPGIAGEVYRPVGCKQCDYTGFHGQVLAAEALFIDSTISAIFVESLSSMEAFERIIKSKNYVRFDESLRLLLLSGAISIEQISQFLGTYCESTSA